MPTRFQPRALRRDGINRLFIAGLLLFVVHFSFTGAAAQATSFAGNSQHTSVYNAPAQNMNVFRWITSVDLNNTGALIHYGAPLVTAANTVIVPVKTGAQDGFQVKVMDGTNGATKYTLATDYSLPSHNWIPAYQPVVASGSFGTRLYYAGAGGTIWRVDNPDSNAPSAPVRQVFYSSLAGYNANASAFNTSVFVNTPITADSNGNIFFGFRVQGIAPAPLSTSQSGFARIDSFGNGTFVLAGNAANDAQIERDSHSVAPALSNDETTLYVAVKWATSARYCYLLGLNATTLQTKYSVFLRDPRTGDPAGVPEDGTASPMVAPDGDVYFGVQGTPPNNGSRGFLLRFSGDLSVTKTPGAFGWDYTAGIVPASLVPAYHGTSSYLLFCKYNEYAFQDGSGVNRVALLDPNSTQLDPHSSSVGLVEMREVLTVIGPTPDVNSQPTFPTAVREWCINAPAVNPATKSVFFNNEDGKAYRWNLATNSLDQAITLNQGIGQPYVPTVIGPDGTVYTLNGGTMFALGNDPSTSVTLSSSSPDLRGTVFGDSITFTASVTGTPAPTGTVTFFDNTVNGVTPESSVLATNVPLSNGNASVTTSTLKAGGNYLGNHHIVAIYNGDGNHATTVAAMMQKVHANASTTTLVSSPNPAGAGQSVSLTATVAGVPSNAGVPTGMVTFEDGLNVIGQVPLNPSGQASMTIPNFSAGSHNLRATYVSDTRFAASAGATTQLVDVPATQLSSATFSGNEGTPSLIVTVTRTGNTNLASTVDYTTSDNSPANNCYTFDGRASSRCDYETTLGTLNFAPGEQSKTISISLVNDAYAEGSETFNFVLSNAVGSTLGSVSTATLTILDNETVNGSSNPIDDAGFFVRQHYIDFLNREPDAAGLAHWTNEITSCGADAACIELKRINVSAAFFLSIEFQETGYLVYRTYKAAFGDAQGTAFVNDVPTAISVPRVRFNEFLDDTQEIRIGVEVGIGNWQQQLESNKQAYMLAFVQRQSFQNAFPASLSADAFVTQLNTNAGGVLSANEKAALVALLGATPNDAGKRAQALRAVAEDEDLKTAEKNRAFVLMEYFGYLRRNPDDQPNIDHNGWKFWLDKLNSFNGNFVQAEMVRAFLVSAEYRQRFLGP